MGRIPPSGKCDGARDSRGDWYIAEPNARFVFDTDPAEIWDKLIQRVSGEWARLR